MESVLGFENVSFSSSDVTFVRSLCSFSWTQCHALWPVSFLVRSLKVSISAGFFFYSPRLIAWLCIHLLENTVLTALDNMSSLWEHNAVCLKRNSAPWRHFLSFFVGVFESVAESGDLRICTRTEIRPNSQLDMAFYWLPPNKYMKRVFYNPNATLFQPVSFHPDAGQVWRQVQLLRVSRTLDSRFLYAICSHSFL